MQWVRFIHFDPINEPYLSSSFCVYAKYTKLSEQRLLIMFSFSFSVITVLTVSTRHGGTIELLRNWFIKVLCI